LASIDRSSVASADLPVLLSARYRQLAYEQAQVYLDAVALSHADNESLDSISRRESPQPWAVGEIAAALTLSHAAADQLLFVASQVNDRMPQVASALVAGRLDAHKAWLFVDYLASLTDEQVSVICDRLVPPAADWTSTQLRARLKRALLEIDPERQHRRYRDAVAQRHLSRWLNDDGSCTVSGVGVPSAEAVAACARVEALAKTARAAGHPCTVAQLRVDVFLGLMSGDWQQLTDTEIVTALLERGARAEDRPEPESEPVRPIPRRVPAVRPRGWEIQIGLPTLLGLDERAGAVAGWGAVSARIARDMVGRRWRGQWRFVILDDSGRVAFAGTTRHRPHRAPDATDPGGVELHLSEAELVELFANPSVGAQWRRIVADLHLQYQRFRVDPRSWFTRLDRNPGSRFIRDQLARYVEIRDRHCTAPHCRRPARDCQLDHTVAFASGGATVHANVGAVCPRHHYAKTQGWWAVTQSGNGRFLWTSPLGRTYTTRGDPIRFDPIPITPASRPDPP
jgi:hypothetical protein